MYHFIDVTEVSEGNLLPSEALKLNSEYIENLIPGYRTLAVSGREALSPELSTYESGVRDGSSLLNRRYPARTIVVKYQLMSETSEAFREAYNQLGKILNVENAEMIFNDEPDKFYIGTPSLIDEVDPGTNAVVGEIEFLCLDPFKYSVVEYEAEPSLDESSVLIDYNGTYKSFPVLEADFFSEKDVADDGETAGTLTGSGDC
ncbi:MAG: phage tail family protein, partial [Clostridiales bacterium]|nr:phage tail family protein [Clostridiales bacterium]